MKKTLILQCPGMVCSPPVVSKCLGEAHRRLELFTLPKSFFFPILLVITSYFLLLPIIFFKRQPTKSKAEFWPATVVCSVWEASPAPPSLDETLSDM